eukprot:366230-Chlamydomonas_euryale.AAC.32
MRSQGVQGPPRNAVGTAGGGRGSCVMRSQRVQGPPRNAVGTADGGIGRCVMYICNILRLQVQGCEARPSR